MNTDYIRKLVELNLDSVGNVFLHCYVVNNLKIGDIYFSLKDITSGIYLIINKQSSKDLLFDEEFITCKLRFQGIWKNVIIPYKSILTISDNLTNPSVIINVVENQKSFKKIRETSETINSNNYTDNSKEYNNISTKIIKPNFNNDKK